MNTLSPIELGQIIASNVRTALSVQAAEVEALRMVLENKRAIFQAGRDSYESPCQPMNTDDEAWAAYKRDLGIPK